MATLMGFSSGITVGAGNSGRSGPGTQIVPDPDPGPPPVLFDDFTRIVSGGWGNATPSGLAWSLFSGNASHFSVAGTYGQIRTGGTGTTTSDKIAVDAPSGTFWSANGYEMNVQFTLGNYIPISALLLQLADRTDDSLFITMVIGTSPGGNNPPGSSPPGPGYWGYSLVGDTVVYGPAISWVVGTYRIRAVARPGIDMQVKLWNVLDAEPSTFTVAANTSDPYVPETHTFRIDAFNNDFFNTGATFTDVQFDYINFT